MRALVLLVPLSLCVACGQNLDHPQAVPACDPQVMHCVFTTPPAMGTTGGGNEAGAGSQGEEVATFSGAVLAFDDDYFDRGALFSGVAQISATSETGARVTANYDGTSFQLDGVLKDPANWFLAVPATGSGLIPTLMPLDTRSARADLLSVGVANGIAVDGIFLVSSGTERALDRAQIVLHLVDEQLRSLSGVTGKLTAEVTAYRAAGSWIGVTTQNATDNSGMLFFGNVPAGSALSPTTINLAGAVTARIEVIIQAGAISVVTAVVNP
jgi:hypothetical protein